VQDGNWGSVDSVGNWGGVVGGGSMVGGGHGGSIVVGLNMGTWVNNKSFNWHRFLCLGSDKTILVF